LGTEFITINKCRKQVSA